MKIKYNILKLTAEAYIFKLTFGNKKEMQFLVFRQKIITILRILT